MKREIWEAEHKCIHCNNLMNKKKFIIEGITVRGWECDKCKETVLHPIDSQEMFMFNKLKKGLPVKIGILGQSLIVRIPKEIAEFYKIKKGESITLKAEDFKKIELNISS